MKTLALEELHNTLAIYTLHLGWTGDIVALLWYVRANTSIPARGGENLRTLLRDYAGYVVSVLQAPWELSQSTSITHSKNFSRIVPTQFKKNFTIQSIF
jgi:hypothetical protein